DCRCAACYWVREVRDFWNRRNLYKNLENTVEEVIVLDVDHLTSHEPVRSRCCGGGCTTESSDTCNYRALNVQSGGRAGRAFRAGTRGTTRGTYSHELVPVRVAFPSSGYLVE